MLFKGLEALGGWGYLQYDFCSMQDEQGRYLEAPEKVCTTTTRSNKNVDILDKHVAFFTVLLIKNAIRLGC